MQNGSSISDPASPLIFSIFQSLTPDINLCSAAKVLNAAVTDLVLLLGISITLVNLEKASTIIERAGK
jgi:hypothetical protein